MNERAVICCFFFTYLTYLIFFMKVSVFFLLNNRNISIFFISDNPLAGDFNLYMYFRSYILACALSVIIHAHISSIVV